MTINIGGTALLWTLEPKPWQRDPIEQPRLSDTWDTPEGRIIVIGHLDAHGARGTGPWTFFDSARGREIASPTAWRKLVAKSTLFERAEQVLERLGPHGRFNIQEQMARHA